MALGLATLVAIVDGLAGGTYIVIGFLSLPPILASATTSSRATALVAGYCLALTLFSTLWNPGVDPGQYVIRVTIIALAGVLSYWSSLLREEQGAGARGAAVLAGGLSELDTPLDEATTAEHVAAAAVPELADVAIVDLLEPDGAIRPGAIAASDPEIRRTMQGARGALYIDPDSSIPVAEVLRSGERKVFSRMSDAVWRQMAINERHLTILRDIRPRSMLVEPLKANGATFGVLSLGSLHSDRRYGRGEISFAEELAERAAIGMTNARLHESQSHLARTLQQNLLPPALPRIKGLEIAARFRPVGRAAAVGGDFYDLFQRGESKWVAVIGDVCGKGPEAAALTSLMRDTLRASSLRGETPSETLSLLNTAILQARLEGRFCTTAFVSLDLGPKTTLVACNGGHPPPLILRKGGRVEEVGRPGTLLGIFEDPQLVDTEAKLAKGDLLMLFTDGLFEAPAGTEADDLRVTEVLAACKGLSAEKSAETVEERVLASHGGQLNDDVAILVLRRV